MLGELVPCGGGDPIPLLRPKLVVGRREKCDIVLDFPNVSSFHCELELINGYWHIRDLRSRNGIKVNGQRCDSKFLQPSDELTIAKHRYEISYEPLGDGPPPEEENPFSMSLLEKAGLMKQDEERRQYRLPPSSRPPDPTRPTATSTPEEDQAMQWLTGD